MLRSLSAGHTASRDSSRSIYSAANVSLLHVLCTAPLIDSCYSPKELSTRRRTYEKFTSATTMGNSANSGEEHPDAAYSTSLANVSTVYQGQLTNNVLFLFSWIPVVTSLTNVARILESWLGSPFRLCANSNSVSSALAYFINLVHVSHLIRICFSDLPSSRRIPSWQYHLIVLSDGHPKQHIADQHGLPGSEGCWVDRALSLDSLKSKCGIQLTMLS